jgi:hypothetical protein
MGSKAARCSASKTLLAGLFCLFSMSLAATAAAQATNASASASKVIESAPSWKALTDAQQTALKPMQADWAGLDASRKKKWLAVAQRYQTMSPADQARMHERMGQWAKLTPAQRSTARDNYSAVLSSPSSSGDTASKGNLNAQWTKYQALSAEKKNNLTQQANKVDSVKTKPLAAP